MNFSGQPYYDQVLFQCFNVVFTCVPVVFYALFDRPETQEEYEKRGMVDYAAYRRGRGKEYFNNYVFLVWMIAANIQAFFITSVAFWALGDGTMDEAMTSGDLWSVGTVVFMWVIVFVSLSLWNRMTLSFWFQVAAIVISCLLQPASLFVLSNIVRTYYLRGTFSFMYGEGIIRFLVATVLAMGIHVLVGEPIISLTELPRKSKVMNEQYDKVPKTDEAPPSKTSPLGTGRSSVVIKQVYEYHNSGLDKECARERQATLEIGRRNSILLLDDVERLRGVSRSSSGQWCC